MNVPKEDVGRTVVGVVTRLLSETRGKVCTQRTGHSPILAHAAQHSHH